MSEFDLRSLAKQLGVQLAEMAGVKVVSGTVVSDFQVDDETLVRLDSGGPDSPPVAAISLVGTQEEGARVIGLTHPPRGLLILGRAGGILRLGGGDASPTSTGHGLQIGSTSGSNMRIDANEIMAIANGAASELFLNNDGGDVTIGNNSNDNGIKAVGMRAKHDGTSTSATTTNTSYESLGTATGDEVEVSFVNPPSKTVQITVCGELKNATSGNTTRLSAEVRTAAGGGGSQVTGTGPTDLNSAVTRQTVASGCSRTFLVSTASQATGVTLFARLMKKSGSATVATLDDCSIFVAASM